ncbi:uncharacterized protein LOC122358057 isoform X2 [Puntigrus tetrazona]|uniref:uncharacterized protein LOC122358057 isoform X2 n=1 Tax=Puntigrus tetrazona TaxID=1606681 RepID=UPI001C890508|nr:uncharacterized protein LOC122358057 isoform X2 [Puntigrus tetrazona]
MMLIFGLMLLLQSAACLDQSCRLNQSAICYAALGHKLSLLIVRNTTINEFKIQKNINYNLDSDPVCKVTNDMKKKIGCDLYWSRTEVTVNAGTLIINPVIRSDSGNYTITVYSSGGTDIFKGNLQVKVEAPIGSVEVSVICSSSGERRASCSSEGDQILYSWTLNGDPPMDGDSFIDLDTRTDGNLSCSVKNNVSHGQKTVEVKPCRGSTAASETSTVTNNSSSVLHFSLIALGCVALILILLFITAYHIYRKKQVKSTPAAAGNEDITYADITYKKKNDTKKAESLPPADVEYVAIQHQRKRKERKEKKEEVEYGEVTFTPNQSSARPRPQEESIYSQVHRC